MILVAFQDFIFNTDYEKTTLMQSNHLMLGIVITYIIFVKILGPSLMKKRKALDLYYFVILFNMMLVINNSCMCYNTGVYLRKYWHSRCNTKYNSEFQDDLRKFGYFLWHALLLKISELIDTIIFVLRKKFNQISFLHVFHHSIVVLLYWLILKKKAIEYYVLLMGSINGGVHVVMYSYYCLSAIGPGVKKYLWWKKYLTTIQILQFFVVLFYMGYSFLLGCGEFAVFEKLWFFVLSVFCALFFNFYFKTYLHIK